MSSKTDISFKSALDEIAKIVAKLESDDCELEEMSVLYAEGVKLLQFCENKINDTKIKIEQINSTEYINKDKKESGLFFDNKSE